MQPLTEEQVRAVLVNATADERERLAVPMSFVLADWDHLGQTGVIGHPFLLGDVLIHASDQSRTGVATYDVSAYMDGNPGNDPPSPPILDVLTTGGPGGYWPEL